ncbi:alpha/beta fold hydrolase [Paenibacillus wynnii]|uniref:alpha/beta fold hydrolase n=1 Tax=Paenibacillus wynnii TaxID=268407 RepID=UPI00278E99E7|nr:alpha/beta fold hydrolase [Paenibacillus wynnii]MDQ0195093.1 alpha-beta hydrolase superfamily lysophospholipase [Paenibacillus wynnii]
MLENSFIMTDPIGVNIYVYEWLPEPGSIIRGILQISHGMCETAARYANFAEVLTKAGYAVYANDHRGHGKTAGKVDVLGDAGDNGFYWMRRNLIQLAGVALAKHEGVPIFLFSHSMGSFLAQKLMCEEDSDVYAGYILSGTNGPRKMLSVGENLAKVLMKLQGERHRSVLLNSVVFSSYNHSFSPVRTAFDWLSSNPDEVDQYISDPFCGAICTTRFFRDFFGLLREIHRPDSLCKLSKDKPIYLFSGDKDPVGMSGKGILRLVEIYREQGVKNLEYHLYPNGRHEMLHEVNRDQVTSDILDWLIRHLPSGAMLLQSDTK